jgi:hypothetical protein
MAQKQADFKRTLKALADAADICSDAAGLSTPEDREQARANKDLEDVQVFQSRDHSTLPGGAAGETLNQRQLNQLSIDSTEKHQKSVRFED